MPTSLFIFPDGHADGCPSRKNLILHYWVGSDLDRLPTDVHACDTIRVGFEATPYTTEVSPVSAVATADVAASWACLARVFAWNLQYGYSVLARFVGQRVAEEAVRYPIRLSSTLTVHLASLSSELIQAFDSDACVMPLGQIGQMFGEEPSVCADVVALLSAESPELQPCFAPMPVLVSVLLQSCAAFLVSDLSQRDVASKVELLQNPAAPPIHHGYSSAVAVLVYAEHILRDSRSRRNLLQQHEETVATHHQDACGNPTISHVCLQADVCSVSLDWKSEAFMVRSDAEDRVSAPCAAPREESFVEAYCWMLDPRSDLASLPGVPLGFLNKLTGYPSTFVVSIDHVVKCGVCVWLGGLDSLECEGRDRFEGCIGFTELLLLKMCQRCKVELQCLLRR